MCPEEDLLEEDLLEEDLLASFFAQPKTIGKRRIEVIAHSGLAGMKAGNAARWLNQNRLFKLCECRVHDFSQQAFRIQAALQRRLPQRFLFGCQV